MTATEERIFDHTKRTILHIEDDHETAALIAEDLD
jgi:hypothetical protein